MTSFDDLFRMFQEQARSQGAGWTWDGEPGQEGKTDGKPAAGEGQAPLPHIDFTGKDKKFWIRLIIVLVVVIGFCYWWFHPSLSPQSPGLWWFLAIFVCLPAFTIFRGLYHTNADPGKPVEITRIKRGLLYRKLSWIPVIIVAFALVGAFASATFFPYNAHRYAKVLTTTEYDFATDIEQVDYSQVPVIDHDSAEILGNRALGAIPDYVSQFEISDLYSQINYQDTPVRVSPLGYADFFKWITNRTPGIPAYVLVDMTNQDVKVVRLNEAMKYTQSEPFCRNIDRYVQLKYPFYLFDQLAFEVDENGHPWWICPVQKRTIGLFGGETIRRVVLVDACTGECQDIAIEDVPEWVDRAYPADLLITQYNWWGLYCNGWWNSWIGQAGVRQTTPGTDGQLGYNYLAKDDDVWVYSGVTSATSDNSIIGFVLINQRTAESHYYAVAGATEDSAMASAEGQVQNLEYVSTFPILLNIDDQPTYFMALKDAAGLVKKYAMIDIQRYQNVAVGDTVSQTQSNYETLLITTGVLEGGDTSTAESVTAEGTVEAIATAVIEGNSHFYLSLEGDERIFDCALPDLLPVIKVQPGDEVSLVFVEGDSACEVTSISVKSGDAAGTEASTTLESTSGEDTSEATSDSETTSEDDAGSATTGGSTEITTEGAA